MNFTFTNEQLHPSENRLATYMKTMKDELCSLYDKYGQDNFILLSEIEKIVDKFEQSLQRNPKTQNYLNDYNSLGTITELTSSCILNSFVQRKKFNELNNNFVSSSFAKGLGKRYDILKELVNSEMNYFSSLVFVYESYYKQLIKKNEDKKQILNERQISKLFQNFDDIKENAKNMLKKLETELRKWPEGRPLIGSVFLTSKPILRDSFIKYGNGIVKAIKIFYKLKKSVESFTQFLNSISLKDPSHNPETQLSLPTLLTLPLDRVIEYNNCLKELLKHTPYDHEDYQDLQSAQEYIESLYLEIKDYRLEALKLQKQFNSKGNVPYILSLTESRRLIREGPVGLVQDSKTKKCNLYLFSDIILLLDRNNVPENKLFYDIIWIKGSIIKELDSEEYLFIIFNSNKKAVLSTHTRSERNSWIKDIEIAIKASGMQNLTTSPVQIKF